MSTLYYVSICWGGGSRRWLERGQVMTAEGPAPACAFANLGEARRGAQAYRAFWEGTRAEIHVWRACPLTGLLVWRGQL